MLAAVDADEHQPHPVVVKFAWVVRARLRYLLDVQLGPGEDRYTALINPDT